MEGIDCKTKETESTKIDEKVSIKKSFFIDFVKGNQNETKEEKKNIEEKAKELIVSQQLRFCCRKFVFFFFFQQNFSFATLLPININIKIKMLIN